MHSMKQQSFMKLMSLQRSNFRIALVGFGSLAIAMGVGRFAFTPVLPLMQDDGLISIAEGGVLASIHFFGYWLGAVFGVKLSYAPKATLRYSLVVIGICTLGMGMTDNFTIWLILRWLNGLCSAWTLVLVSNYYVKHFADNSLAVYQGWVFSGVGAGIFIVGLGCLVFMISQIGSSLSWQIMGAISLITICVVCLNMGPEISNSRLSSHHQESQRSPLNWDLVIPYGAMGIGYIIPATYLPIMARDIIQSPFIFGWAWPVFGVAALLSTLLAAKIQNFVSNRRIWATCQIIMAAGLLFPVVYPHISTIIIAGICVGGTFMVITMAGMKEAHRNAPPHDVMRHIAVMTAAFASGQIIGPVFASSIYDLTESFSAALLVTSIVLIVTALKLISSSSGKFAVHT